MSDSGVKIHSVDVLQRGKAVLIHLTDDSSMLMTLEQIIMWDLPRVVVPAEDEDVLP